jgi:nicotinamidase-related amidase
MRTDVDFHRAAVLPMDLQRGVVSVYVKDEGWLERVTTVLRHARQRQVPVIHVRVAFRPGVPEASPRNMFLSAIKASLPHQRFFQGETGAIHPAVGPEDTDLLVTKTRVSAFAGTDLDLLLRALNIETLVLFGLATSGVVLSTALQAADLDYRVVIVKDCCVDLDAEVHACLIEKILPRQALLISSSEFLGCVP